jgi:hypothetical protein
LGTFCIKLRQAELPPFGEKRAAQNRESAPDGKLDPELPLLELLGLHGSFMEPGQPGDY